ncbi:hypothetical protein BOX15_Mlig030620g2 [Macrostomum lignano]|uniref:V-SNARE coiled-coil homology domain-containing protein n=1 Tax=Macrostomum lignano TaxID=282301 RepID=A0A267EIE8_9PLAT|nr:hypothetical protein BOX15_Mlig030620g1 [Macrostomum lignano]PAA59337.1 hypothetical protein BOX15_Mlig001118g2 [Macrostomum lignano]PAA61295.1 hypothetical protein BOX15_Mlig001118g1 [Macrostomum lignano]PAA74190.1 hypothetical protein BOX15_Mlig030620g2 [Macrostomum lignano]
MSNRPGQYTYGSGAGGAAGNPGGGGAPGANPGANSNMTNDQMNRLQRDVNDVTGIMRDNMNRVIERDANLNDLMARSDNLHESAVVFQRTSQRVSRKYWWQNTKMKIIIAVVVIVLIIIIVISILASTGAFDKK